MTTRRGPLWLFGCIALVLGACSGDDSSPTGSGGSGGAGGTGGAGATSGSGGTGGSTAGGSGGAGGEAGSGGTAGAPDGGTSDAPSADGAGEAGRCLPAGTINVTNDDSAGYLFDNGPLNPVLTLCRGNKYTFAINTPGHPFFIRQQNGTSFTDGVTGNHISSGNLVFDVPQSAPNMLFYQCDIHEVMTGPFIIVD